MVSHTVQHKIGTSLLTQTKCHELRLYDAVVELHLLDVFDDKNFVRVAGLGMYTRKPLRHTKTDTVDLTVSHV